MLLAAVSGMNYLHTQDLRTEVAALRKQDNACAQAASAVKMCLATRPGTTFPR